MPNHASTCYLQISFYAHNDFNTQSFKVIVASMFPLQSFMWLEMDMLLYLLCLKFLRAMTIVKLEECWRVGNKKAPKVCCHIRDHSDSLGALIHMVLLKRINFNLLVMD